tara:strand:- start:3391 stop:3798 length:408 start_codon:yes stop_codon:yes gene_type:complete
MINSLALILLISGSPAADIEHKQFSPDRAAAVTVTTSHELEPGIRELTARERILRRRAALRGGQQKSMDGLISLIQSKVAPDCWEFGGASLSVGTGNGPGSSRRNAENLAELMQQTIQPLSWEINGGNGSIQIFP